MFLDNQTLLNVLLPVLHLPLSVLLPVLHLPLSVPLPVLHLLFKD